MTEFVIFLVDLALVIAASIREKQRNHFPALTHGRQT